MKKQLLTITTFAAITLSFIACQKEKLSPTSQFQETKTIEGSAAKVVHIPIENYMKVSQNPQWEKFNLVQLDYAYGLRKALTDPIIFNEIIEFAKQSNINTINFEKYLYYSNGCKQKFNEELGIKYPEKPVGTDYCVCLKSEMLFDGQSYVPAIKIPNVKNKNLKLDQGYYIAIGTDVENEDKDYIPAWHIKKNGQIQVELIDEHHGTTANEPVIIISEMPNITGGPIYYGGGIVAQIDGAGPTPPPSPQGTIPPYNLTHRMFKLNRRFENDNTSEYYCNAQTRNFSTNSGSVVSATNDYAYLIKDVDHNSIGSQISVSVNAANLGQFDYYNFITYERDWYAGMKSFSYNGFAYYYEAKFNSEFYAFGANLGYLNTWNQAVPIVQTFTSANGFHNISNY